VRKSVVLCFIACWKFSGYVGICALLSVGKLVG